MSEKSQDGESSTADQAATVATPGASISSEDSASAPESSGPQELRSVDEMCKQVSEVGWEYAGKYEDRYGRSIPYDGLDIATAHMDGLAASSSDHEHLRAEEECSHKLIGRQGDLLTGVVNALKGKPPELTLWSHHDAPELAQKAVAENARLRAALECLLPGLVLDLRYANDDDDKDAMRSRIDTVRDALATPAASPVAADALPTWEVCNRKSEASHTLTALERFILDNEPAPGPGDPQDEVFRSQLAAVVTEALGLQRTPSPEWFDAGYLNNGHCPFMRGDMDGPSCALPYQHPGDHQVLS